MKFSAQRLRYVPIMKYRIDMADFRGATITGSIPVTEKVLNELANEQVSDRSAVSSSSTFKLAATITCKWASRSKLVHSQSGSVPSWLWRLPRKPTGLCSLWPLTIRGLLWIAELFARERLPQGFIVQGGQMVFDFAAMPAIARYVAYLQSLQITTQRGTVFLSFHVRMN